MPDQVIDVPLGTTATQLQAMINAAAEHTTFRLAAGTYTFDKTVTINKNFVSLIGAGSDQTKIVAARALGATSVIQVGHELYKPVTLKTFDMTASAQAGDTTITVEAGHTLQVGDIIYISQENTAEFLDSIGDTQWQKSNPLRTLMAEVTAVNGNQITFDSPLTFDYDPAISTVELRKVLEGNSLSGFTVEGDYGTPDPGNFNNVIGAGKGAVTIMIGGTTGMTVTDVGIKNAVSSGILISDSTHVDLTQFTMDGAFNKGADGNGYALWLREVYDSSFTELNIVNTRHAVVFASYTTESGNYVQVTYTNRDINFHGGQDQFNIVVVDASIRNAEEQRYMSTSSFFNPGTFYGAPTDPTKNSITFKQVVASNKDDTIYSHADGSTVSTVDGNDTIYSAAGNDIIDGGNGTDLIYASGGTDAVQGGAGTDKIVFANSVQTYTLTRDGDTLIVTSAGGVTRVTAVETVAFSNGSYSLATLLAGAGNGTPPDPDPVPDPDPSGPVDWTEQDTTGIAVVDGTSGWDRYTSASSFVMGANLEGSAFSGSAALNVFGNTLDNNMLGNGAANRMEGRTGNDKIYGGAGNDTLIGGEGNDTLEGSTGNDALTGGAGNDQLYGGDGNDQFLAAGGTDTIDSGAGTDTATFTDALASYALASISGGFTVTLGTDVTTVKNTEVFVFNGVSYSAAGLMQAWLDATGGGTPDPDPDPDPVPTGDVWEEIDATGLLFVNGTTGYQTYSSTVSFAMGNDLEASKFKGDADLMAIGNSLNNYMKGNDGANRLEGRGGNDRIKAYDGNDTLVGGSGNDDLSGGDDSDVLAGGTGSDSLEGGKGMDSFVFLTSWGQDRIEDFDVANDTLILGIDGITTTAQLQAMATQTKHDVLFDFGNGDTLLIEDVTVAQLMAHVQLL